MSTIMKIKSNGSRGPRSLFWSAVLGVFFAVTSVVGTAYGGMITLEGINTATTTTGDLLDETGYLGITIGVVEIPGLQITARSGSATQTINATAGSLGINADGSADTTDAFEDGESLILSFNQDIRINRFDFNRFDFGETFFVSVGGASDIIINYADLNNKISDLLDTNVVVFANTEIVFSTSGSHVIGLDGLGVEVIPEPAVIGLMGLAGLGFLMGRRLIRL